jgi:hypothetical protein
VPTTFRKSALIARLAKAKHHAERDDRALVEGPGEMSTRREPRLGATPLLSYARVSTLKERSRSRAPRRDCDPGASVCLSSARFGPVDCSHLFPSS